MKKSNNRNYNMKAYTYIEKGKFAFVEKQIPEKPNYPNKLQIKCPVCGTSVLDGQPYCDECGQAFDWSDIK